MLWFIWMLSILLSAISLLVMLALILRRMVLQRRRGQDAAERSRLLTALIAFSEDKNAKALEDVLTSVPPRIATRLRRMRSASPGGSRPSVESQDPARISNRPTTVPVVTLSSRIATPSASATTGFT